MHQMSLSVIDFILLHHVFIECCSFPVELVDLTRMQMDCSVLSIDAMFIELLYNCKDFFGCRVSSIDLH